MAAPNDREDEVEDRPSERRRREKKERDPNRPHKSSRRSSKSKIDPETGEPAKSSHRRRKEKDEDAQINIGDAAPEIAKTMARPDASSRSSLPYPSFSKAHSKEAVSSAPKLNVYTPDPTDVADGVKKTGSKDSLRKPAAPPKNERPPSPPDTEFSQQKTTGSRISQVQEEGASRSSSRSSSHSLPKDREDRSKLSSKASTTAKATKGKPAGSSNLDETVRGSDTTANFVSHSIVDSDATSVAPGTVQPRKAAPSRLRTSDTDSSAQDSSPKTPTQTPQFPPSDAKSAPLLQPNFNGYGAVPPPPPPPPNVPVDLPRVDYLMHNGGLPKTVPKSLFGPDHNIERVFQPCIKILHDYQRVLECDGSLAVATGHKSVARRLLDRLEVVFQRELTSDPCACALCQDHPRDCKCSICRAGRHVGYVKDEALSWGDVLEWVSGRIELPVWPAFDFNSMGMKATGDRLRATNYGPPRPGSPVNLDPDIAEEFREHYLRQSEKKKKNIDTWLASCPDTAIPPPPHHIDDETLTFTILTHLENEKDREYFNALLAGASRPLDTRAPSPFRRARSEFMAQTGRAIQRLYRLPMAPRDPEAAIYLLKNPKMHNLFITLTGINTSEWEILISGRFDGFLWSGAESEFPSMNNSPNISRNPTPANGSSKPSIFSRITSPFSPSRKNTFFPSNQQAPRSQTSTPFTPGLSNRRMPVSNDEEMEMAVASEIERNLYQYMEVFEDAFEDFHRQVEDMRQQLRERVAGLSLAAQLRRPSQPEIVCSTPGLGPGYERNGNGFGFGDAESEMSENNWLEGQESEICPNDSASQISSNRFKTPKRRTKRRTPALVEEDEP